MRKTLGAILADPVLLTSSLLPCSKHTLDASASKYGAAVKAHPCLGDLRSSPFYNVIVVFLYASENYVYRLRIADLKWYRRDQRELSRLSSG
jgi:hypothetical protein